MKKKDLKKLIREHEKLIKLLRTAPREKLKEEAEKQVKELKEYKEKLKEL